jgi:hypothetical protein
MSIQTLIPNMLSIFINLIFVSGFCFLLIVFLEYAIYLWENQKINDLTNGLSEKNKSYDTGVKRNFSVSDHNSENFNSNSNNMKINLSNKYFERSLILVTSQDYKGWFEKATEISKKIANNFGYYIKKTFKYIIDLSKSGNNFPDQEIRHIKSTQSAEKIKQTAQKINQITENDLNSEINDQVSNKPSVSEIDSPVPNSTLNEFANEKMDNQIGQITINKPTQSATLNLAIDDDKSAKDTTTYDKIEKSILAKLQETGLNHYDIWLELGQFYQKYDEKEKAKEIFAMVMKHAQGRDKDLARDGLIALS